MAPLRHLLPLALWVTAACTERAPASPSPDTGPDTGPDAAPDALDVATADLPPSLVHPAGRWEPGDLHVHATGASNDTRGMSFPPLIARVARERGLTWIVLTDHSNSTGSDPTTRAEDPALYNRGPEFPYLDEAARLSEPGRFVMVDGNEVSPVWSLGADAGPPQPRGHLGCIPPADLGAFRAAVARFAFTDRPPGAVRGGDNVAAIHGLGAWAVLNHPHAPTPHIAYDWSSFDYDAIEVWNGPAGYDPGDSAARDAWLCDLASGRRVVAVGGSDCHEAGVAYPGAVTNPAIGFPTTSVYARELAWPALSEALRRGRAVVHSRGTFLALWAARAMGDAAVMPGDRLEAPAGTEVVFELEGVAVEPATVTLYRTAAGRCEDRRRAGTSATADARPEAAFRADVGAGPFRVFARVRLDAGTAFAHAELHAQGGGALESDLALTNAITLAAAGP